ncbi:hypothetical protein BT96DRAFT_504427 [Gymnopus androsaceus JB14]|uniref:Uncharacterized protein n=1 Tax=Gymnopus androsaceus JB14 TaxID=1447944 RepID=A0A6A4HX66_9AGAR|nr:hypothetical protein BT96DRAFT_504427 [Gymnopus androsaceus JB14]
MSGCSPCPSVTWIFIATDTMFYVHDSGTEATWQYVASGIAVLCGPLRSNLHNVAFQCQEGYGGGNMGISRRRPASSAELDLSPNVLADSRPSLERLKALQLPLGVLRSDHDANNSGFSSRLTFPRYFGHDSESTRVDVRASHGDWAMLIQMYRKGLFRTATTVDLL